MKYRKFDNVNRDVSIIGRGNWYIDEADRVDAVAALRRGLDLGMKHIDTAEVCGAGMAEAIVGKAITGRRGEVFLVSKVLPQNASLSGTRLACERSLRHLRTDRLDCYLLHWRGPQPLEATFEAFENLRQAGNILSRGVSNLDIGDLEDAVPLPVKAALPATKSSTISRSAPSFPGGSSTGSRSLPMVRMVTATSPAQRA